MNGAASALSLLAPASFAVAGAHMALRPKAYLGRGRLDASDPATVRWFGRVFATLATLSLAFLLLRFTRG